MLDASLWEEEIIGAIAALRGMQDVYLSGGGNSNLPSESAFLFSGCQASKFRIDQRSWWDSD